MDRILLSYYVMIDHAYSFINAYNIIKDGDINDRKSKYQF